MLTTQLIAVLAHLLKSPPTPFSHDMFDSTGIPLCTVNNSIRGHRLPDQIPKSAATLRTPAKAIFYSDEDRSFVLILKGAELYYEKNVTPS